jgi:CheY-like chemotaxis protein
MNHLKRFFLKKEAVEPERPAKDQERAIKSDMLDLFIHDMRGPLSVVSTSAHNLLHKGDRYGPLTDSQQGVLERILRNTQKTQLLLQDMIEVFRSEANLFHRELFSPERVLREALLDVLEANQVRDFEKVCRSGSIESLKERLAEQGIFFEISGPYQSLPFSHDPRKIQQILRNLISNGIKYRRRQLRITIRGDRDLFLLAEDDGLGIPLEKQKSIFERFVRLTNQDTDQIPGLGLGLSGVKALVESMGGEITLKSQEGQGSSFMVRIPPLTDRKENVKVTESILNGRRILAVDDEPDVLEVLGEEILAACPDCQIDKATTYEAAKELLNSWRYDIVMLDIMGVRGFDLLDLAVKHKFPVVMFTAHALSPEALKRSIEMGARAYLPKEKLGEVVPFLEDILEYEAPAGWNRLFGKLGDFFDDRFGPNWRKSDDRFWGDFNSNIEGRTDRVIIK